MTEEEQKDATPDEPQAPAKNEAVAGQEPAPNDQAPPQTQRSSSRSRIKPSHAADYFTACPRCSYFLASYRLIFQDFDESAANATGEWIDLSWNLAVRDLVGKSYGYEMTGPIQVLQGVCPTCRRAFIFNAGDDEESGVQFNIQIKPR